MKNLTDFRKTVETVWIRAWDWTNFCNSLMIDGNISS